MRDASWVESLRAELAASGPEAASVMSHPAVEAAIEGGGGAALERALRQARPLAATHGERELIDRLLTQRRLFMAPVKSAPTMFRLNGVGTALHGAADRARDGTYIATLFFTFVFVPVVPLSSWLVRHAGDNSWNFFGKVPLSRAHRIWRWVAAGLVAALVLFAVTKEKSPGPPPPDPTLHIVNELDVPLTLLVGDAARALGAHAVTEVTLPPGRHTGVAKGPTAEVVETIDLDLAADDRFYAWNVLGAAPLRVLTFEYVAAHKRNAPDLPLDVEDFAGTSFVAVPAVQYAFREAPATVKMLVGESSTQRRRAFVLDGGLTTACTVLAVREKVAAAADLAERVAVACRDEWSIAEASERLAAVDRERVRAFATRIRPLAPRSVEAHRLSQTVDEWDGRKAEARETYRKAFEARPDDADAAYLYARMLPSAEAAPVLAAALARHPDHRFLLRAAAWAHLHRREFAPADAAFERLARVDAKTARQMLSFRLRAMVGAGRVAEAQRLALSLVSLDAVDALFLYGRLRRLTGPDPTLPSLEEVYRKLGVADEQPHVTQLTIAATARDGAWFERIVADAASLDPAYRDAARVAVLSATDVAAAADLAATLPAEALGPARPFTWDVTTRVAVGCELFRTSRADLARRFVQTGGSEDADDAALVADPTIPLRNDDLDLEVRAACLYALARRADDPTRRAALLEEARAFDLFRAVVPGDAK